MIDYSHHWYEHILHLCKCIMHELNTLKGVSTEYPLQASVLGLEQNVSRVSKVIDAGKKLLNPLQPVARLNVLSHIFSAIVAGKSQVPEGFLRLAAEGMQNLHTSG